MAKKNDQKNETDTAGESGTSAPNNPKDNTVNQDNNSSLDATGYGTAKDNTTTNSIAGDQDTITDKPNDNKPPVVGDNENVGNSNFMTEREPHLALGVRFLPTLKDEVCRHNQATETLGIVTAVFTKTKVNLQVIPDGPQMQWRPSIEHQSIAKQHEPAWCYFDEETIIRIEEPVDF